MEVLFYEYGTVLRLEDDDRLVLNVLCGRVGQYGVEFTLDNSEIEAYKRNGDSFVKELEERVRLHPKLYGRRGRFC
jgi:hypothetical protein